MPEVTHSSTLSFRRPLRWIYEPLLRRWLQAEVEDEVHRLRLILDGDAGPLP